MSVDHFYQDWLDVFTAAGIEADIAAEEFKVWAEQLGGELDNEFTQNQFSVISAADEAIKELYSHGT